MFAVFLYVKRYNGATDNFAIAADSIIENWSMFNIYICG